MKLKMKLTLKMNVKLKMKSKLKIKLKMKMKLKMNQIKLNWAVTQLKSNLVIASSVVRVFGKIQLS